MRKRLVLFVLIMLPIGLIAQLGDSPTFEVPSDAGLTPSDVQMLLDYRLPQWGYQQVYLDLRGHTNITNSKVRNYSSEQRYFTAHATPYFTRYREGEDRTFNLVVRVDGDYTYRHNSSDIPGETTMVKRKDKNARLQLAYNDNFYFTPSTFFDGGANLDLSYLESKDTGMSSYTEQYGRYFTGDIHFGLGIGKVRNIDPIIRAMRWNTRYQSLTGQTFSRESVSQLSQIIARRGGYNAVYDRSPKYYYSDLPAQIQAQIEDLSFGELMYLADADYESIGTRLEGMSLSGGIQAKYYRFKSRGGSQLPEYILIGPYYSAMWYHNCSTNFQWGIHSSGDYAVSTHKDDDLDYLVNVSLAVNALWNTFDRMLITGGLGVTSQFGQVASAPRELPFSTSRWSRFDTYEAMVAAEYFLENQVSFTIDLNYQYYKGNQRGIYNDLKFYDFYNSFNSYDKRGYFDGQFGIRYYFKRNWL